VEEGSRGRSKAEAAGGWVERGPRAIKDAAGPNPDKDHFLHCSMDQLAGSRPPGFRAA